MTITVDWDAKPQLKQTLQFRKTHQRNISKKQNSPS